MKPSHELFEAWMISQSPPIACIEFILHTGLAKVHVHPWKVIVQTVVQAELRGN